MKNGDRVEVIPYRTGSFNPYDGLVGMRGTVSGRDSRLGCLSLELEVVLQFDGTHALSYIDPCVLRKLNILELIAEAAT